MPENSQTPGTSGASLISGRPRICVVNAKGGVGKTTTAINLTGGLNDAGLDALFVDMDPQGVATIGLGLEDEYESDDLTLYDVLLDPSVRDRTSELIVAHEEMDVIPSNIDLLTIQRELLIAQMMAEIQADETFEIEPEALEPLAYKASTAMLSLEHDHAKFQLDDVLQTVEDDYDVIVVDAPPNYGEIFDQALFAAPDIIVPALAESSSKRAIELLFDQVAVFEAETDLEVIDVAAIANRIPRIVTNESKQMIRWLNMVFRDEPVVEIGERVALQYSFKEGVSVYEYGDDDLEDLVAAFDEVAATVINHFDIDVDQPVGEEAQA
ncbi:ParA family protein [Natrinema thermotolerans]|uniref:ParA family protein n=1 Tax=Natrinema thermotolerans TaxID=121872 RepID=UPI00130E4892|nr:ParA family protein [Natrinema thermotolerans]